MKDELTIKIDITRQAAAPAATFDEWRTKKLEPFAEARRAAQIAYTCAQRAVDAAMDDSLFYKYPRRWDSFVDMERFARLMEKHARAVYTNAEAVYDRDWYEREKSAEAKQ